MSNPYRRTNRANLGPKRTADGKYFCLADNKTFKSIAEWDKHCSTAHLQERISRCAIFSSTKDAVRFHEDITSYFLSFIDEKEIE